MIKVAVGIVNKDNKILMIKRQKKEGKLVWSFPSGKQEGKETLKQTCVREVYEETNLLVEVIKEFGTRIHPDTEVSLTYYLCNYIAGEIKITHPEEVEAIEFKTQEEFNRDVTTDIYGPVKKYIRENIK